MEARLNFWKISISNVLQRFQEDKCSSVAAELTITSLLALVPLTTLLFALLALIPNFDDLALRLQQYLFEYFVPVSDGSIQIYLVEFVDKAKSMSGIGFVMLFITGLMMMRTINRSFNHIWKIKRNQSRVRTFLVYWAVLTLGPIALGASLLISSYINSITLFSETVSQDSFWFKTLLPMLMTTIAFSVMYFVIPNRKIQLNHALVSAVIAALLFELAKGGFGLFVTHFSTYELIFGAIATIPLFLIWIYVSWNIVLFGAQVCFGFANQEPNASESDGASTNHYIRRLKALIELSNAQTIGEAIYLNEDKNEETGEQNKDENENVGFYYKDLINLVNDDIAIESNDSNFCLKGNASSLTYSLIFKDILNDIPNKTILMECGLNDKSKLDLMKLRIDLEDFLKKTLLSD